MNTFFIPRRSVPTSAQVLGSIGAGIPMDSSPFTRITRLAVPQGFRRYGMQAFQVNGDSMTSEDGTGIIDGSYVLVDSYDLTSHYGHVHAFQLDDGQYVAKRLRLYRGSPALYSDNPNYVPVPIEFGIRRVGYIYAFTVEGQHFERLGYRSWDA